jgi:hypothetical protein
LLLTLTLPRINPHMTTAVVKRIYATEGASLSPGAKLLDLSIDLSAAFPQDCPPISYYRLTLRERVWLRRLDVAPGDERKVGAAFARFSTEPNEPFDKEPVRSVRVITAGIIYHSDLWAGHGP